MNLRAANFGDYPQIAALCGRYRIGIEPRPIWEHLWTNNPANKSLQGEWPIGWVLENGRGEIVGTVSNVPLAYELGGERLLVSTSRSWVVDEGYRSYSVLLLEQHFSDRRVDLFLHPTVNAEASAAYSFFSAARVPVGKWDESDFWITGYRAFATAALKFRYSRAMNPLAPPLAAALFARDVFRNKKWQSTSRKLELCTQFDSRFDTFWNDLRAENSSMLLAVRSSESLHRHFEHALSDGRVWVLAESLGNRIRAYAIFCRRDNPALRLNRVRLIDYQSLDRTVDALPAMLAWAIRQARRSGVHVVENVGFRPYGTRIIEEHAPYRRKLPSWLYFYKARDQAIQRRLADPAVWNPSWFDGDASL